VAEETPPPQRGRNHKRGLEEQTVQKEAGNENKEGRGTFGGIMRSSYDLLKRDWKAHMLKDIERLEKPLARGDDLVFKKQRVVYLNRQPSASGQVMISVQGVAKPHTIATVPLTETRRPEVQMTRNLPSAMRLNGLDRESAWRFRQAKQHAQFAHSGRPAAEEDLRAQRSAEAAPKDLANAFASEQ